MPKPWKTNQKLSMSRFLCQEIGAWEAVGSFKPEQLAEATHRLLGVLEMADTAGIDIRPHLEEIHCRAYKFLEDHRIPWEFRNQMLQAMPPIVMERQSRKQMGSYPIPFPGPILTTPGGTDIPPPPPPPPPGTGPGAQLLRAPRPLSHAATTTTRSLSEPPQGTHPSPNGQSLAQADVWSFPSGDTFTIRRTPSPSWSSPSEGHLSNASEHP